MLANMVRLVKDESAASAVEYGLLVGLIAVAIVGILILLGGELAALFQTVINAMP